MRWFSAAWLLFLMVLAIGMSNVPWGERISADVGDLLPEGEAIESQLVRSWVQSRQAGTVWAVLQTSRQEDLERAWVELKEELETVEQISQVIRLDEMDWLQDGAEFWWQHRFGLRFPGWWAKHRAKDSDAMARFAVENLIAFLDQPDAFVWDDLIPGDPLLLLPTGLQELQVAEQGLEGVVPIMLVLSGRPLDPVVQEGLTESIGRIRLDLQERWQSIDFRYTGVVFFAQANRQGITAEVSRLNLSILLSVLLLMFLLIRSFKPLAVVAVVVGGSVLCGATAVIVLFDQVHVLALVLGAVLAGIAADYAIHTTTGKSELRKILFPLVLGFGSTVIGFSLFLVAPLLLLKQTGVFVMTGLAGALLTALCMRIWIAPTDGRFLQSSPLTGRAIRLRPIYVVLIIGLAVVFGVMRLNWTDDLRMLEFPTPELYAEEEQIQSLIHAPAAGELVLVSGENWREARERMAIVLGNIDSSSNSAISLWEWIPDPAVLAELEQWLAEESVAFIQALEMHLEEADFEAEAFSGFFDDWQAWVRKVEHPDYWDALVEDVSENLRGPLMLLFSAGDGEAPAWFSMTLPAGTELPEIPGVVKQSQLNHLNALFAQYRKALLSLILIAAVAMSAVLLVFLRRGEFAAVLAVVCGSIALGMALVSIWRTGVDMFDLMGAFLGACLILDYGLFALNARRLGKPMPVSIHLSALTTVVSFAWLTSSSVAAVQHLGQTVGICVLLGWSLTWIFVHGKD